MDIRETTTTMLDMRCIAKARYERGDLIGGAHAAAAARFAERNLRSTLRAIYCSDDNET